MSADERAFRQNEQMLATERDVRVVALLEDNVLTELQVANAALELGLSDEAVENIMQMVTSQVLYAFSVDWSPDWVKPGDVHAWQDDNAWHARCPGCLLDSPPSDSRNNAARWAHEHEAGH